MDPDEQVVDSPQGWVARHIKRYLDSDGANGHEWRPGVYTLLLTTRGRRTGKRRRTALIYGRDGDRYLVVASVGGAPPSTPPGTSTCASTPRSRSRSAPSASPARPAPPSRPRSPACGR